MNYSRLQSEIRTVSDIWAARRAAESVPNGVAALGSQQPFCRSATGRSHLVIAGQSLDQLCAHLLLRPRHPALGTPGYGSSREASLCSTDPVRTRARVSGSAHDKDDESNDENSSKNAAADIHGVLRRPLRLD